MNTIKSLETDVPDQLNVQSVRSRKNPSRWISKILHGDFLTRDGLVNHLPFIAYLVFLFILNISLIYLFESTERRKASTRVELQEAVSAYNTVMSKLETSQRQSSVTEQIQEMGLHPLQAPPQVIDVEPGYFEE